MSKKEFKEGSTSLSFNQVSLHQSHCCNRIFDRIFQDDRLAKSEKKIDHNFSEDSWSSLDYY
jgi:hypothetical protein